MSHFTTIISQFFCPIENKIIRMTYSYCTFDGQFENWVKKEVINPESLQIEAVYLYQGDEYYPHYNFY
jgi:hypothetical protein